MSASAATLLFLIVVKYHGKSYKCTITCVYNKYVVRLLYVSALRQPQFVSEVTEKAAIPVPGSLWADCSGGRAAWRHAHHRESISRMHRAWNCSAEEADLSPPGRSRQPLGWRSWATSHGWTTSA